MPEERRAAVGTNPISSHARRRVVHATYTRITYSCRLTDFVRRVILGYSQTNTSYLGWNLGAEFTLISAWCVNQARHQLND
jgi:hypothetical protein